MRAASSNASKLISAEDYAQKYLADMGFEHNLITARQDCCLEFLADCQPHTVLEVGCGPDLLIDRFDLAGSAIRKWVVVEPSSYADDFERRIKHSNKLALTRGYLEDQVPVLRDHLPGGFDAVLLSGLLHETTQPANMLNAAHDLLRDGGHLFVSVPNANSFHRLLAVEMGMMDSPTQLSDRNLELGHPVVYNRESLTEVIEDAGFQPEQFSGYMFKPFSNGQMAAILKTIGDDVVDGLNSLGKIFPDNAAEIAISARKPVNS
ncbi:methyltransferase domain-containing protein [Sphingobium sp. DEHP117]|uniref:class I SAM-dependent methyltransferase n=1 Tax=Sphingobium sp. DEHP117 TaxID=2993436 RepID=UPI0027D5D9CE|nr:methyltransferase domain-containing protein [Sphingobium sp. DEHP117]MDQ4421390.1 methyltransferase domain-containing protein [Sphingobium sp. DEHP117]